MTFDEMLMKVRKIFPNATIGEDLEGQYVVYTDMMWDTSTENKEELIVPFVEEN